MGAFLDWRVIARRRSLALLLLIDQFARNIYRGQAKAYPRRSAARARSRPKRSRAASTRRYPFPDRVFFYLPFEHCETMANQERYFALIQGCLREFGEVVVPYLDYGQPPPRRSSSASAASPTVTKRSGRETTEEEAELS